MKRSAWVRLLIERDRAASHHTLRGDSSGSLAMFAAIRATNAPMDTAQLPENVPTHTNSFVIFAVLCLLIFALMAFAKFMERRE